MTFRKRIRKNKFRKNDFHTLQGTMSHRPLTNTSSLKITAAYCAFQVITNVLEGINLLANNNLHINQTLNTEENGGGGGPQKAEGT